MNIAGQRSNVGTDLRFWVVRPVGFEPASRCLEGTSRE
jgi:hypothetical protein